MPVTRPNPWAIGVGADQPYLFRQEHSKISENENIFDSLGIYK
jgi:hypothetical protein